MTSLSASLPRTARRPRHCVVRVALPLWATMLQHLLRDDLERAGFLLARAVADD